MLTSDESVRLRSRYQQSSDGELLELAAAGEQAFTEEAWLILSEEMAARSLQRPENVRLERLVAPARSLDGIDGWLLGFAVLAGLGLLVPAFRAGALLAQMRSGRAGGFEALLVVVFGFLLPATGLWLIQQRFRIARRFWQVLLGANSLLALLMFLRSLDPLHGLLVGQSVAWTIYWLRAERVRQTFLVNGRALFGTTASRAANASVA